MTIKLSPGFLYDSYEYEMKTFSKLRFCHSCARSYYSGQTENCRFCNAKPIELEHRQWKMTRFEIIIENFSRRLSWIKKRLHCL